MQVLHVDDDSDDRGFFLEALKEVDSEISCIQFESGYKLLAFLALTENVPDFIVIDINMPKMNGYECLKAIRSIDRMKDVLIVMHSTVFSTRDRDEFIKRGVKILFKENHLSTLSESIKDLLFDFITLEEARKK